MISYDHITLLRLRLGRWSPDWPLMRPERHQEVETGEASQDATAAEGLNAAVPGPNTEE